MGRKDEILGLKIAPSALLQPTAKINEKAQKRVEHEAKVQAAKTFFRELETINKNNLSIEEKIDLLLDCFIHAGPAWANMENISIDTLGNPFKD